MIKDKKLGAFIVPTGVGASIGGFAGDAGAYARKFAQNHTLIVNPNVVNAGGFSAITDNMLYVEGYSLDEFFKGNINLLPSRNNKIGIIFDKAIPQHILNVHLNTMNAVKAVYGIDIPFYEITDEEVGVTFNIDENGVSNGSVKNQQTLLNAGKNLLNKGVDAIAIVCFFKNPEEENPEYQQGQGVDPVGGVEAIISHFISKELQVPCAHAPAFDDLEITTDLIDAKAASEYITPTFLPCILLGLNNAPKFQIKQFSATCLSPSRVPTPWLRCLIRHSQKSAHVPYREFLFGHQTQGINIKDLDYLIMPSNCLGSVPVFECIKRNIPVYAIEENQTILDITKQKIFPKADGIISVNSYWELLEKIAL